jgi:hypothetical protein
MWLNDSFDMEKFLSNIFIIQCLIGCSTIAAASLIDESNVQENREPITVGQVEKKYGKWEQGHGPYLWYKSTDGKNEIWFWYLPKKNTPIEKYEVALITKVDTNDADRITILWPMRYKNMKFQDAYRSLYKEYEGK